MERSLVKCFEEPSINPLIPLGTATAWRKVVKRFIVLKIRSALGFSIKDSRVACFPNFYAFASHRTY